MGNNCLLRLVLTNGSSYTHNYFLYFEACNSRIKDGFQTSPCACSHLPCVGRTSKEKDFDELALQHPDSQIWHSHITSGSNIPCSFTDNSYYAINLSLATQNRGKHIFDICEHANNQQQKNIFRCQTDGVISIIAGGAYLTHHLPLYMQQSCIQAQINKEITLTDWTRLQ